MLIKICGLKIPSNINELAMLNIDMMGFIFYEKSSRFVGEYFDKRVTQSLPKSIRKVGVFVDEDKKMVLQKIEDYGLDVVQLHGNESVAYCEKLKAKNIRIIKAFQIDDVFYFSQLAPYQKICDYFLFDTKGKEKGGNGISFNWEVINKYQLDSPFLLSGGIGVENIEEALSISHPQLVGFDINSKIEVEPALKSVELANILSTKIKNYEPYKTR
jgi:phosphoribosylanthranilate isomerase